MLDCTEPLWADVFGYFGLYRISTDAEIINVKTGKVRKPVLTEYGYHRVSLVKDGVSKMHRVHRLVAETFLPNPENHPYVNHINADRTDNRLVNVEWISPQANLAHAVALGNREFERAKPLSKETVAAIKERYVKGCPVNGKQPLALEFNTKSEIIRRIVNGLAYQD